MQLVFCVEWLHCIFCRTSICASLARTGRVNAYGNMHLNSRAGQVTDADTLTQVVGAQDWQRTEISSAGPALAKANMNHCKHDDSLSRFACSRNHAVIIRLSRRRMISNNDWLMIQHRGCSLD